MDPSTTGKRRKLSLFNTVRARNGGANDELITLSNTPSTDIDAGSDTEDEGDEETAQFYLCKMTDVDNSEPKETVFGEGVEVWKSHGGTIYADLTDKVKRKIREEELWGQEAKDKVQGGLKRKAGEEATERIKVWKKKEAKDMITVEPIKMPLLPGTAPILPSPTRDPSATRFHHSSAGIDTLGAHSRPIHPLPKRRAKMGERLTTLGVGIEGRQDRLHPLGGTRLSPRLTRANPLIRVSEFEEEVTRPNRIVSGSFGSFRGEVDRFDERAYRLGPKTDSGAQTGNGEKVVKKAKKGDGKPDLFKGKAWLR